MGISQTKQITMKTAMTELKEMLEKLWANSDVVIIESIIDFMNDYGLEKEKEQMFNLIRFMRINDKMGKSVEDLFNEFYNK